MRRVLALALLAVGTRRSASSGRSSSRHSCRRARRSRSGRAAARSAGRGPRAGWPAPRITEYKPRTTLVVPAHPRPRAKFPVIDIHSHQPTPISAAEFDRVVAGMEQNNLRLLVNLSGGSGERLKAGLEAIRTSKYPDRMVLFANVDFRDVGPGFGAKAAAAARGGHQGRRQGTEDLQGPRPADPAHRRQPPEARRSGARSDLGGLRPAERPRARSTPPSRRSSSSRSPTRTNAGWSWRSTRAAATRPTRPRASRS